MGFSRQEYWNGVPSVKSVHDQRENRNCRENLLILFPHFLLFVTFSNHDGVITHLEPDILDCEVKWVLGSITTNKTSDGDGIQLSYLKS